MLVSDNFQSARQRPRCVLALGCLPQQVLNMPEPMI
jgi:hypothetical protein